MNATIRARRLVCALSGTRRGSAGDARFKVMWLCEGSTDRVSAMEHVDGTCVGEDAILRLPQADRNEVREIPPP